jgi:hypothetical protein
MRGIIYVFAIALAFASPGYGEIVYKWVDHSGVTNLTDNLKNIPPRYQNNVVIEELQEPAVESMPPEVTGPSTDLYGHGEAWWRGILRPRMEQFNEAAENYDRVNERFIELAAALSKMRFASRTQVKMKIIQLDQANSERLRYERQMAQARNGIEKLLREAEEAKADPAWLH